MPLEAEQPGLPSFITAPVRPVAIDADQPHDSSGQGSVGHEAQSIEPGDFAAPIGVRRRGRPSVAVDLKHPKGIETVLGLIDKDPQLRIVLKEFPVLGPGSIEAAKVAVASFGCCACTGCWQCRARWLWRWWW